MLQHRGEKGRKGESLWEGGGRGGRKGEKSDPETDTWVPTLTKCLHPTAEW